ncbi:PilZ domain-containing protein [Bacillus sp. DTU_2020_1000418_1_SI_GHA_SEK_038]|uniref:PilZ domain-containing protein n=1 Tax=Bacillus sp. DTU_2020_1000418_1_SI_GHA_SEK_038 TaxID=3077585 RepID=UPI0028E6F26A|nr:PilZ domain-containing protein [Bacillus sp. DTU_2020_1000418_1_SI_GHA_SEK_038]WNS76136.1 PilZ domain-containing protein [Bacillus sp. DTU_2020_1000418_1_SI_GHA_SEK_038]
MKYNGFYKRQEGFRLAFNEPIPATFTILNLEGKVDDSQNGFFHILDMSVKGAKIISIKQIHIPNFHIKMECVIVDEPIQMDGELIWEKKRNNEFIYGVSFIPKSYSEQQLLQELKKYVIKNKSS